MIVALLVAFALALSVNANQNGGTPAGSAITNRAEATYSDDQGITFSTVSSTVTFTVMAVATLTVTPKEIQPSASVGPQERVSRLFRICNTGNILSNYTITQADVTAPATVAALFFGSDQSGTLIQLGQTVSPDVAPGSCISVLAVIDTNDSPPQTSLQIRVTARSNASGTANGVTQDTGTIVNLVGAGPRLTDPQDPTLPPSKRVNGLVLLVAGQGVPFTYSISFRNSGDISARAVVLADDLPTGIDYVPGSLQLNQRTLSDAADGDEGFVSGSHVEIQIPEVKPGETFTVTLKARLSARIVAGVGFVNYAALTGENITPTRSNDAVVMGDPFGVVFAGRAGNSVPLAGARVEIFADQAATSLLAIPTGAGFTPNPQNENPFTTDPQGRFSFALAPQQLGTDASPASYFMKVTSAGYVTRMLALNIRPSRDGLFILTIRALDAQPLASAGSFDLVRNDVQIADLGVIAFNIPMFESQGLEITKSVDRTRAEIGDTLTYRIQVHNPTASAVSDTLVRDRLPDSFHYVANTARLSGGTSPQQPNEPQTVNGELVFAIGELARGATAQLLYRVRIGANAHDGDQQNVAFAAGRFLSGEQTAAGPAIASVRVGGGVFSTRQIIIGRVFEDTNGNGEFDTADKPMPDVRLYLNSGQSVVTDFEGLYNFPSLGDGAQVIALDPTTVPKGHVLSDGGTRAGRSWTRLLRTPIGGGALLRQNFILVPIAGEARSQSAETAPIDDKRTGTNSRAQQASKIVPTSASILPGTDGVSGTSAAANLVKTSFPSLTIAGRYEFEATETIAPVAAGSVQILSPAAGSIVMTPALEVMARVTLKWTVKLEVNGEQVSEKNIGTSRLDQKNQVATFTFVSIGLRPGPNVVRVTPISPAGYPGHAEEVTVMGRGQARRIEIVPEKTEIHAGGHDSTVLKILLFDQWNHPANDNQVAIESSLGQLVSLENKDATGAVKNNKGNDSALIDRALAQQASGHPTPAATQLVLPLNDGAASVRLVGPAAPGAVQLRAFSGEIDARTSVRVVPEIRSTILVGLAEASFGRSVPEINLRGEQGNFRNRLSFFYSGRLWRQNILTLSYDTQRPINRTTGHDRVFQLDPLDRVYPLFGDSSTRYEAAPSNSKLYARLDHGRSYAMFGDFEADMEGLTLAGYARKLTGVKLHAENSQGDFATITGARPDTAFARDVFPAGTLSILHLSNGDILQGSENVVLEVRDRRNPEVILSSESLIRSVDYNLNPLDGQLFLLRYISTFDASLNLMQLVVTYEHRAAGISSGIYTGRAQKSFKGLGLKLGLSTIVHPQSDLGNFFLGGIDGEKALPLRGKLRFAWARSRGQFIGGGNAIASADSEHNGDAYQVDLAQPLPFRQAVVRARYQRAAAGFFNPFGGTITPGSRRGEASFEFKPLTKSMIKFGLTSERNQTATVNNSRLTLSAAWDQVVNERLRFHFGFDHRDFNDDLNGHSVGSNLITAAAEINPTDKLQLSIKREQNLTEADPTYPNQTTFGATYRVNEWVKIFLTQRLASAPIVPIADVALTGFAATGARRETAIGVETRLGKLTSMIGRYQIENGINGNDSFAVIGLQHRLPVSDKLSLDLGFERGFHLAGKGQSFDSATVGFGWQPNSYFRASARYEFRDRGGAGRVLTMGAAGRVSEGITALSRFQISRTSLAGRDSSAFDGLASLAIRPLKSDRIGLLFSYNHRSLSQQSAAGITPTRDRIDSISSDGYYQATRKLELYGRFALRFNANGQADLPFVSSLTMLTQARAQYRLTTRLDWAGEMRTLWQASSRTRHSVYATELGFWALPDLRLGVGYNFNVAAEPAGGRLMPIRRGFYFTISSKLSNLFNLFGTSKEGLASHEQNQNTENK